MLIVAEKVNMWVRVLAAQHQTLMRNSSCVRGRTVLRSQPALLCDFTGFIAIVDRSCIHRGAFGDRCVHIDSGVAKLGHNDNRGN